MPTIQDPLINSYQAQSEVQTEASAPVASEAAVPANLANVRLRQNPANAQPVVAKEECCKSSTGKHIANCCCATGLTVLCSAGIVCICMLAVAGGENSNCCFIGTGPSVSGGCNDCSDCLPYPDHWRSRSNNARQERQAFAAAPHQERQAPAPAPRVEIML